MPDDEGDETELAHLQVERSGGTVRIKLESLDLGTGDSLTITAPLARSEMVWLAWQMLRGLVARA